MAIDDHQSTVGDYVSLVRGTTYKGDLVGEPGPALLGLGSIEPGGGFRIGSYKTYGGECPEDLMLFPGDIYASLKGATKDGKMIGSVARVPATVASGRLTQDTVKLVFRDPSPGVAPYLYWVLRTPQYRAYCDGHAMGSAVVALSRRDFLSYPVPAPTTQRRKIVSLLEGVEEKIELNRRMNETLEAMARALFKSWFVDFDPVRAKAEGRDPGFPQHLADQFPDSFEDSELGEIPRGWKIKRIRDVTCYLSRGIGPAYMDDGGICVLNQKCVRDRRIDFSKARRHDRGKKSADGRLLQRLDILVNSTGVGTLGRAAQLWNLPEPAIVDSHVSVLRAAPGIDPWFLGVCLTGRESEIEALGEGSTGQTELSRVRLGELACVVPPTKVQHQYGSVAEQLLGRLASSQEESATLATLRDTLLPKLISGEMRVPDAERYLERVAA